MTPDPRVWTILGGCPGLAFGYQVADAGRPLTTRQEAVIFRHCSGMIAHGAPIRFCAPEEILIGNRMARYQFVPWEPPSAYTWPLN